MTSFLIPIIFGNATANEVLHEPDSSRYFAKRVEIGETKSRYVQSEKAAVVKINKKNLLKGYYEKK